MNMRAAFTGLMLLLSSPITLAGENPVLGTWKLKSFVREVTATGERIHQYGEHPSGYLSYSADGRMYAIGTSDNRRHSPNMRFKPCFFQRNAHWPVPTRGGPG